MARFIRYLDAPQSVCGDTGSDADSFATALAVNSVEGVFQGPVALRLDILGRAMLLPYVWGAASARLKVSPSSRF